MSILSVAYLKEGIVLSSDCRGTHWRSVNGVMECRTEDRAPKTFLINSLNIGISYCGNMRLNGELFHFAIKDFVDKNVKSEDNTYTVAKKLFDSFKDNGTLFLVGGYINEEQHIYVVDDKIERLNQKPDGLYLGIKPYGKTDSVLKLISDKYSNVDCNNLSLNDGIMIAEEWVRCAIENEESCGEPVSTLVIKKDTSIWIKRNGVTQDI